MNNQEDKENKSLTNATLDRNATNCFFKEYITFLSFSQLSRYGPRIGLELTFLSRLPSTGDIGIDHHT